MEIQKILSTVDHTLLSQTATLEDIYSLCDDGIKYSVASVCIPPCYVKDALLCKKQIKHLHGYRISERKLHNRNEML